MKTIKTLLFDFGDVFIDLDKDATINIIKTRYPEFEISEAFLQVNAHYETGAITTQEFVNFFKNHFKTNDDKFLISAWNAIIKNVPDYRLQFLKTLKRTTDYQLILLSNTNALHIEQVIANMGIKTYNMFKSQFDAFYLSHEIHLRKPEASIFQFILHQHQLAPDEIFYIDDTEEHILQATSMGIHTWHLNPTTDDITDLYTQLATNHSL